jgi:uncharacterized small protein (DUF1192 family)
MEESWDKVETQEIIKLGFTFIEAKIIVGRIAEHRQRAYMQGINKKIDEYEPQIKSLQVEIERLKEDVEFYKTEVMKNGYTQQAKRIKDLEEEIKDAMPIPDRIQLIYKTRYTDLSVGDIDFLIELYNHQKAEIERLKVEKNQKDMCIDNLRKQLKMLEIELEGAIASVLIDKYRQNYHKEE